MKEVGNPNAMNASSQCSEGRKCNPYLAEGSASITVTHAREHEANNPGHTVTVTFYGMTRKEYEASQKKN